MKMKKKMKVMMKKNEISFEIKRKRGKRRKGTNGFGGIEDEEDEVGRGGEKGGEKVLSVLGGESGESVVFVVRHHTRLERPFSLLMQRRRHVHPRAHFHRP